MCVFSEFSKKLLEIVVMWEEAVLPFLKKIVRTDHTSIT